MKRPVWLVPALAVPLQPVAVNADHALFREDFATLDGREPLTFPKIGKHTEYSIQTVNGKSVLKPAANASASGVFMNRPFNPHEPPFLRWRWRGDIGLEKGDADNTGGRTAGYPGWIELWEEN